MVKVSRSIVPSIFTMGNMFLGFLSVIKSFEGDFVLASWLIFGSAFLDTMDGKVARFVKASSKFGVEYDSLADVISFGFAPSVLIYLVHFSELGVIGIMVGFMPLMFGSIRLARFNVNLKGFDKSYFTGLPIPAAALTIASFVIFQVEIFGTLEFNTKILLVLVAFVSVLMVSNFRYETMPNFSRKGTWFDRLKIVLLLAGVVLLILFPVQMLFPLMAIYVLSGILGWIFKLITTNNVLQGSNGES